MSYFYILNENSEDTLLHLELGMIWTIEQGRAEWV